MKKMMSLIGLVMLTAIWALVLPQAALAAGNWEEFVDEFDTAAVSPGGGTVTLSSDVTYEGEDNLEFSSSSANPVTIDTNGHSIIINGSRVTLGNNISVTGAADNIPLVRVVGVQNVHTSTLALHGANITKTAGGAVIEVGNVGILNMLSGTISGQNLGVDIQANGGAFIGGGSITTNTEDVECTNGLIIRDGARATINGSPTAITATGNGGTGISVYGELTLNGTSLSPIITGNGDGACGIYVCATGTATVSNGQVLGLGSGSAGIRNDNEVTVEGGIIYGEEYGIGASPGSDTHIAGGTIGEKDGNISANGIWQCGGSNETPVSSCDISNGTIKGKAYGINTTDACIIEITGGTIDASSQSGGIGVSLNTDSFLTIDGGVIEGDDGSIGNGLAVFAGAVAIINESSGKTTSVRGGTGIYCEGQTLMTGGAVTGTYALGAYLFQGELEITGGSINGAVNGAMVELGGLLRASGGTITGITNGIYNQGILSLEGEAVTVSGGKALLLESISSEAPSHTFLYNGTASSTTEGNEAIYVEGDSPFVYVYSSFTNGGSIEINETNTNYFLRQSLDLETLPSSITLKMGMDKTEVMTPNGQNIDGSIMRLQQIFTSPAYYVKDASDTNIASFTVSDNTFTFTPLAAGTGTLQVDDTVTHNGIKNITINVESNSHHSGSSSNGSSSLVTSTGPMIDVNGSTFNPSSIDTGKDSYTITATPDGGTAYVAIPYSVLKDLADKTKNHAAVFTLNITAPYGSYLIPVDLTEKIAGLTGLLAQNHLSAQNISFKVIITDKSDNEDILKALAATMPNSNVLGSIVDFKIAIINNSANKVIGEVNTFSSGVTRTILLSKDLKAMPQFWGTFRYNENSHKFEFVPHKLLSVGGLRYVTINSRTNSVYVVAEYPVVFSDLKTGYWGTEYITKAAAKGCIKGVGNGIFDPNRDITRAEFVQMIVNVLRLPAYDVATAKYEDVADENAWYYDAIMKAKAAGILTYFNQASFNPNAAITQEEMAGVLAGVIRYEGIEVPTKQLELSDIFTDYNQINSGLISDIEVVYNLGVMQGAGNGKLSPQDSTSRVQAAVVLTRLLAVLDWID